MKTLDKIRKELIIKIISVEDMDMLVTLDEIVSIPSPEEIIQLTSDQISLLELSAYDIQNGKLIDQSELGKLDREWLSAK